MNRGDMPAMALSGDAYTDFAGYDGTSRTSYNPECQGMTIRERMAMAAMQGLLCNPGIVGESDEDIQSWIAARALEQADALLAQLERTGAKS